MASQSFLIFQSRSPRINGIADRSELSATGRVYSMNRSVIRFEYLPSSLGIPPLAINFVERCCLSGRKIDDGIAYARRERR